MIFQKSDVSCLTLQIYQIPMRFQRKTNKIDNKWIVFYMIFNYYLPVSEFYNIFV